MAAETQASSASASSSSSAPATAAGEAATTSSPARLLEEQDEDVRIAVRALGDMRMRKGARYEDSTQLPPIQQTQQHQQQQQQVAQGAQGGQGGNGLVSRVSNFPLVGSALRAYDYGKNSSRVVKYGAQMVESSISAVSRPLIDRLPVNVEKLDEFACQQLDRLDRYRRPSSSSVSSSTTITASGVDEREREGSDREREGRERRRKTFDGSVDDESISREPSRTRYDAARDSDRERGYSAASESGDGEYAEIASRARSDSTSTSTTSTSTGRNADGQVVPRSRWQAVLLEAGGLGAALSEESMRRLKYCLQWLQYATAHIDAQILILRDFIASLQPLPSSSSSTSARPPISEEHLRKLTAVRRDIVHTIRQVVDVVSKYAGGALPEPARGRVRGFILKLPQRWASATRATVGGGSASSAAVLGLERERERGGEREVVAAAAGGGAGSVRRRKREGREGVRSAASSRATSPASSPRLARLSMTPVASSSSSSGAMGPPDSGEHGLSHHGAGVGGGAGQVSHGSAVMAAQRILTLATESLDMMRGVTGVVKESLDRADAWVGRLRSVGLASVPTASSAEGEGAPDGAPRFDEMELDIKHPPHEHEHRHTRNISTLSEDHPPSLFFSSSSSSTTGSLPSTPFPPFAEGDYTSYNYSVPPSPRLATAPGSPIASAIGRMSLASRLGTPKGGVGVLPEEELYGYGVRDGGGEWERRRAVKEEEEEEGEMDVDSLPR